MVFIRRDRFWSSVDLTGNQTTARIHQSEREFWSSVDLTGNQTQVVGIVTKAWFWSSVDLTGNQTVTMALSYAELVLEQCRSDW